MVLRSAIYETDPAKFEQEITALSQKWNLPSQLTKQMVLANVQAEQKANLQSIATAREGSYTKERAALQNQQTISNILSTEGQTFTVDGYTFEVHFTFDTKTHQYVPDNKLLFFTLNNGEVARLDSRTGLYTTASGSAFSVSKEGTVQKVQMTLDGIKYNRVGDSNTWSAVSGSDRISMTLDNNGNLLSKTVLHIDGSRDTVSSYNSGSEIYQRHYDSNSQLQWTVRSYQSNGANVKEVLGANNELLQTQSTKIDYNNGQKQVVTTITDRLGNVIGTTTSYQTHDSKTGQDILTTVISDAQGNPVQIRTQSATAPAVGLPCGGTTGTPCGGERDQYGNLIDQYGNLIPGSSPLLREGGSSGFKQTSTASPTDFSKSDTYVYNVNEDGSRSLAYIVKPPDSTGTSLIVDPNNKPIEYQQTLLQGPQTITNTYGVNSDGTKGTLQTSQITDVADGVDGSVTTCKYKDKILFFN